MIKVWKKLEIDVGSAIPGDPLKSTGRLKLLTCPLCFENCSQHYWGRYHSRALHQICPICKKWFLENYGLGQHWSKSQCGLILIGAIENIHPMETVVIRYIRS